MSTMEGKYGHHSVQAKVSRIPPQLDLAKYGPFDVGVAVGGDLAWRRSNHQLKEEWHDSLFLLLQHHGRTRVDHCLQSSVLQSNDLMVVQPVGDCAFEMAGDSAIVSLNLPREWLDGTHADLLCLAGNPIDGSRGMGRVLSTTLGSLANADASFDEEDRLALSEVIVAILARCKNASSGITAPRSRLRLNDLKGYVIENIHEPSISPKMLAKVANLSLRQLYRLFAQEGIAPQAWVSNLRLAQAHKQLQSAARSSVTEIAFAVGFNDAAHFSRAFRKRYGLTPSTVRSNS
ncbi:MULTISPECIES: helix-turn-helix domain-containing protein [unclassified Sphingobium]|uniref:helix-turn-helix domain-containing protein n=1 Tax=unclassified Sphingobium TaxID=2611147 RepID=UPI0015E749A1|nr:MULTISPECIES: helix-turn-helix domain-containing protein [unclassified Sphingobium]MBG6120431.1 AraC-like DNA-binding protein [Sphingobium sp. JAI105]